MFYYVVPQKEIVYKQITLDDFLSGDLDNSDVVAYYGSATGTRTYEVNQIPAAILAGVNIEEYVNILKQFNQSTNYLRQVTPRSQLYDRFFIPKKSGGLREINAPKPDLMKALRYLKYVFEVEFKILYHTNAYAYVQKRSTVDVLKKHQKNKSNWFAKFDLKDFFPSTTLDFVMNQCKMIFPFSEICKYPGGEKELRDALELGFLNGGLPQGTPLSPTLTNVMMIPIDYRLGSIFRKKYMVVTRYADDFHISSRTSFDVTEVSNLIDGVLHEFNAPFRIKQEKTHYGNKNGKNWMLGLMYNKDHEITIGHKKKKQIYNMVHNYMMDKKKNVDWPLNDIQVMVGHINYLNMVEEECHDRIIKYLNDKYQCDVLAVMKEDIARLSRT